MGWSKVITKYPKPLGWWYHKVMCEIGWALRNKIGEAMYYRHLDYMIKKYKINLYGERY